MTLIGRKCRIFLLRNRCACFAIAAKIETPEEDAIFAVYLKSAGSYEAAKDTERDYLTCDENGFAQSKDLPYGVYTVHQVSG